MIPLARSLLVTWVAVWSTSRQDVALHLVTWIIIGSAVAAYFRNAWLAKVPYIVEFAEDASEEAMDILPESKGLVSLVSFAVCGMSAFFLAGAEHKSNGRTPMRGAWIAFAVTRILLPISACGLAKGEDVADVMLFGLFALLSIVGPLSSWPSRSFVISDAVYALVLHRTGKEVCSGTEAAVVAAGLALAHDLVHTRFLHFLESAAFAIAAVFIVETTLLVVLVRSSNSGETWNDALNLFSADNLEKHLLTKTPPVVLAAWATGMFFRTFTQGRISATELVFSLAMGACFGLAVLLSARDPANLAAKPSFACATVVMAMTCASRLASGRKRVLKKNKYIVASGFFAPVSTLPQQDNEIILLGREDTMSSFESQDVEPETEPSAHSVPVTEASATSLNAPTVVPRPPAPPVDHAELLVREYEGTMRMQTSLQKNLFYLEALSKGHSSQKEKDDAKADIARAKAELEKCRARAQELHQQILQQEA